MLPTKLIDIPLGSCGEPPPMMEAKIPLRMLQHSDAMALAAVRPPTLYRTKISSIADGQNWAIRVVSSLTDDGQEPKAYVCHGKPN